MLVVFELMLKLLHEQFRTLYFIKTIDQCILAFIVETTLLVPLLARSSPISHVTILSCEHRCAVVICVFKRDNWGLCEFPLDLYLLHLIEFVRLSQYRLAVLSEEFDEVIDTTLCRIYSLPLGIHKIT
jgi:hypothetical protein